MKTARQLSGARQRLRLTLADLARRTSIHSEYLAAIEDGEPEGLPPAALLEWILPIYAAELGLDPAELPRRYLQELRNDAVELSSHCAGNPRPPQVVTITGGLEDFVPEAAAGELELNTEATVAYDASADDLPLHATLPQRQPVASAAPAENDRRPSQCASLIAVIVGFVTGLLLIAALPKYRVDDSSANALAQAPTLAHEESGQGPSQFAEIPTATVPPRALLGGSNTRKAVDLSGSWVVTNQVESTSYNAFRNLRIGYQLTLTHDGQRIKGAGQKWEENGERLPMSRRTPIALEGNLTGGRLDLRFTESGARRTSSGIFVMQIVDERTLRGSFMSDAANSRGHSVALRDPARAQ